MNTLRRKLEDVGLSEKQAAVYLAALELGPSPAQKIAERAAIKRATTYVMIEELMELGLMASTHKGKKQLFVAEEPDRLTEVLHAQRAALERRQEQLKDVLPELQKISPRAVDEPIVKYYLGKKGIFTMLKEFADVKDSEVKNITPMDRFHDNYTEEEKRSLIKINKKNKGRFKVFYTGTSLPGELDSSKDRQKRLTHIEDHEYPLLADISIYDNKVRIITMADKEKMIGIGIDNKEVARTLESLFDIAWDSYKKR